MELLVYTYSSCNFKVIYLVPRLTVDLATAAPTTLTTRQTYVEVARTLVKLNAPSALTSKPVKIKDVKSRRYPKRDAG
jgi:hypothetical protein